MASGVTYLGVAAVFGLNSTITGKTPANCIGTLLIQKINFKKSAMQADIGDKTKTVGRIVADRHQTLNITGIFTGTNQADALVQAARTPEIGDIITVADADGTYTDAELVGDWVVTEDDKTKDIKSPVEITITMDRFPDSSGFTSKIS